MYTIDMKAKRIVLWVFSVILVWSMLRMPAGAASPFDGCNPADSADPQINTALGCVPVRIDSFVQWLLPFVFGIGGGISFLLMVYGFIVVATSGGDPKKAQGGQETISSAITGLLVCIFGLFILRLIAIDILHIPGIF